MNSNINVRKKGSIFYIGAQDKFPDELEHCINREINEGIFVRIKKKNDLCSAQQKEEYSKRLFLIDDSSGIEIREIVSCLIEKFPQANLCMLVNDTHVLESKIRENIQEGLVRSILPMNLRVDLWLGAIRLMLNGGHYIPADAIRYMGPDGTKIRHLQSNQAAGNGNINQRCSKLTKRELEVLHLISEGHQNKNIADKLSISEHTIKLHIHHIISKLGVNNRTEAAAVYLQTS
ncbi:MAG: response regulator transcription factor [Roseibium sp.]